jgi:hypothetical protein
LSFPVTVKYGVKPVFDQTRNSRFLVFSPFFAVFLAFSKRTPGEGAMLPNHARYQLRYTPEMI